MNEWNVEEAALRRVRSGVLGRVRRRRRLRRAALAITALLFLALLLPALRPAEVPLETLALTMPAPPTAPAVHFTPRPPHVRGADRIILLTSDPDVIFILVADGGE